MLRKGEKISEQVLVTTTGKFIAYLGRGTESLHTNDRAEAESGALSSGSDRDATQQQCGSSWGAMIGGGDSDCDEAADFLS